MLAKAGVLTDFPTEAGKTPQNFSQADNTGDDFKVAPLAIGDVA